MHTYMFTVQTAWDCMVVVRIDTAKSHPERIVTTDIMLPN